MRRKVAGDATSRSGLATLNLFQGRERHQETVAPVARGHLCPSAESVPGLKDPRKSLLPTESPGDVVVGFVPRVLKPDERQRDRLKAWVHPWLCMPRQRAGERPRNTPRRSRAEDWPVVVFGNPGPRDAGPAREADREVSSCSDQRWSDINDSLLRLGPERNVGPGGDALLGQCRTDLTIDH